MKPENGIPDNLSDYPTVASLTALIGEDLFAKLSAVLAGRRIYIPHKPGESSPMAVAIGLDAAQKISHVYGGLQFEMPHSAGNKFKVRQLLADKVPVYQIANQLGVSRRFINRIQAEDSQKNQHDLFSKE